MTMRQKHRRDKNNGKNGLVSGNPRYRGKGHHKGNRAKERVNARRTLATVG